MTGLISASWKTSSSPIPHQGSEPKNGAEYSAAPSAHPARTQRKNPGNSRVFCNISRFFRGRRLRLEGFEPPTYGSVGRCSIQLSYRRFVQSINFCSIGNSERTVNRPIIGTGGLPPPQKTRCFFDWTGPGKRVATIRETPRIRMVLPMDGLARIAAPARAAPKRETNLLLLGHLPLSRAQA